MIKELTLNKIAAGLVGIAMMAGLAFAFTATRAHASELSDLVELFIALEIIAPDKADEARAAVANMGGSSSDSSSAMSCNFTRNLSVGDTGADVMELQKFLNANGYTVAMSGAGSPGNETQYYGPATAAAVSAFQEAYASEILAPLGLTSGTGYFGASTRAKANAICAASTTEEEETPSTPNTPNTPANEEEGAETTANELSGEASLVTFEMDEADDDTIEEGDEDAPVAVATVEFKDGDALITRLDVSLSEDTTNPATVEDDPWDTFETVSLYVDGEKVAEENADNQDDYLDDAAGTLRFSGLDILAMEDEELEIEVRATVMNSVDGITSSTDAEWDVSIDSMRYKDGDDVTTTEDSFGDIGTDVHFTIEERGGQDEIVVKSSTSDPDSSIIKVQDDQRSDWVTVFAFDIDTNDSENDIVLDKFPVTVVVSTTTYENLVADARLVIDGTTIDSNSSDITYSTTTFAADTGVILFDVDKDVEIAAGDKVTAKLELRFNALSATDEAKGPSVQGKVTSTNVSNIEAEGADDLSGSQLQGSATGETHYLLTTGIFAEIVSTDTDTKSDGTTDDALGEFTIKFDVTAFEDTYYISTTTAPYGYSVLDSNGVDKSSAGTTSVAVSSTATKEDGSYRIDEGETETFTLVVTYDPSTAGNYKARLDSIVYGSSASTPTGKTHLATPSEDFETDPVYINS